MLDPLPRAEVTLLTNRCRRINCCGVGSVPSVMPSPTSVAKVGSSEAGRLGHRRWQRWPEVANLSVDLVGSGAAQGLPSALMSAVQLSEVNLRHPKWWRI